MASRAAHSARAYRARETRGVGILSEFLHIPRKTTAIIGSGGKSTLLRALAEELAPAITQAIYRATGVWHRELPILPEHIVLAKPEE